MLVGPLTPLGVSLEMQKKIRKDTSTVQPISKSSFNKKKNKEKSKYLK